MGMLKMAINSSSSFRNSIRINYQELTSVIKESAKILKKQGTKITEDAIEEIVMLMTEWNSYEELKKSVGEALKQIKQEKDAEKLIDEWYKKAKEYATDIEEEKGNVTIEDLRDRFFQKYLLCLESGETKFDLIGFDRDICLITMAIEHELEDWGVTLKNIVSSWENKLKQEYKGNLRLQATTLVQMVKDNEYCGENDEPKWMIDSKYVRAAADCVVNPEISREYMTAKDGPYTQIGDELDHLYK